MRQHRKIRGKSGRFPSNSGIDQKWKKIRETKELRDKLAEKIAKGIRQKYS